MTPTPDDLSIRRRRAAFRAWHRGMREMDILLGRFADVHLATLDDPDLAEFERLLDLPDQHVLSWFTGGDAVPAESDTPLFRRIAAFHTHGGPLHA